MTGRMWERGPDGQIRRSMPPPPAQPKTPTGESVWRALGRGLRSAWDYLGCTLSLSILWCLVAGAVTMGGWGLGLAVQGERGRELAAWLLQEGGSAPPGTAPGDPFRFLLASTFPFALWSLVVGPLTAGIAGFTRDIVAHEHPVWTDLIAHVRAQFSPAVCLAAAQAAVTAMLVTDVCFFAAQSAPGLKLIGILFLYPLLFWGLALPYQWPLLVEQRQGVWPTIKKSALLVLDNPGFVFIQALVAALFSLACLAAMVGVPLLWAGALAFLHTEATRALLRKYGVLPPEPDPEAADEGWNA